jgi:hypothetical protein
MRISQYLYNKKRLPTTAILLGRNNSFAWEQISFPKGEKSCHALQDCEPSSDTLWLQLQTLFLQDHKPKCEYRLTRCFIAHCSILKPKIDMKFHAEHECKWRKVHCPHCKQMMRFFELMVISNYHAYVVCLFTLLKANQGWLTSNSVTHRFKIYNVLFYFIGEEFLSRKRVASGSGVGVVFFVKSGIIYAWEKKWFPQHYHYCYQP